MTSRAKPRLWLTAAATAFLIIACYKVQQFAPGGSPQPGSSIAGKSMQTPSVPLFNKEVGRLVRKDTTSEWIEAYNRSFSVPNHYMLASGNLTPLLANEYCTGLLLYNGLADSAWVVLPYALRSDGSVIKTPEIPLGNGFVSWAAAEKYRAAYRKKYPGAVEGHFFGSNIFFKLINEMGAISIIFRRGSNGKGEQLIMSKGSIDNSSGDTGYDADASFPCPPFCPK